MSESRTNILIVEDDISSQNYYSFVFNGKHDIRIVSNILQAKQALAEESFGIALIDLSLPGGENGLDLIKYLDRELSEDGPIAIALTAHVFPHDKAEALAAGASEFLTKPIMSTELLNVIAKYS